MKSTDNSPTSRDDWGTPWELFDMVDSREGPFTLDAAAEKGNSKIPENFITKEMDALNMEWDDPRVYKGGEQIVWLNPPYGKIVKRFMEKAREQALKPHIKVVCLVAARPGSSWWYENVWWADEIWFLMGRVKFIGAKQGAMFDSAIVIFGKEQARQKTKIYFYDPKMNKLYVPYNRPAPPKTEREKGTFRGYGVP